MKTEKIVLISLVSVFLILSLYFVLADFEDNGLLVQNITGCGILNTSGATYTLNQSIDSGANGNCIIIANESIILDCAGNNITFGNSSGEGIGIINMESGGTGFTNVTIKNCNIYENSTGFNATAIFFGANSSDATIFNNTITTQGKGTSGMFFGENLTSSNISSNILIVPGNSTFGIGLVSGLGVSINLNDITISGNLSGGIYFIEGVIDSNITSNDINISVSNSTDTIGILLWGGSNSNLLYNNTITTSGGGIGIENSTSTNISSNTIISSASNLSTIYLKNANSSVLENNNITTALMGIYVQGSPNTNISSNNITSSGTEDDDTSMIRLEDSDGSIIDYNIIISSNERASGIAMEDVNSVLVNLNTITTSGNNAAGIYLNKSEDNTNITSNNIITNNTDSTGIFSTFSNSTLIFNNTITTTGNSSNGIYILNLFNTIANNTINTTNGYAIYVAGSIVADYNHTIENNTEQGENILYLFNNDFGIVEDQTLGQLIVTNSTNVTINNVTVNYDGLTFVFTNDSLINNSNFTTTANRIYGIDFFESSYNNVTNCEVKTLTGNESCVINFYSNSSDHNIFYNNIFNVTAENSLSGSAGAGVCWEDSAPANNIWNTTKTSGTNIIGGPNLGGNFWTNSLGTGHSDTCIDADGDYICDTTQGVIDNNTDYLPLTIQTNAIFVPSTLSTANYTYYLNQSITVNGTCFNITANNITLNFNGYNITGNTTGYGINISGNNTTIFGGPVTVNGNVTTIFGGPDNGVISNFSNGVYVSSSSNNNFGYFYINNSVQDAILLEGNTSDNNNFTGISVLNTNASYYDINFSTAGIDGAWIKGISGFENYTFTGAGGKVNFQEPSYGEIKFIEAINESGTSLHSDVDIESNWVFVNSSSNSGLNKSANISFYNVSFTDPKPQYSSDNSVWVDCTASTNPVCTEFSYTKGGTFKFNVSHFTYFKIIEGYSATTADDTTDDSPGGGGGIPPFWTKTYVEDDEELSEKGEVTKELKAKHRIRLKIDNGTHYVGVISLTNTTATINVSSTPQQATLSIGDLRKFEVTNDSYYDLSVALNSINSTSNKANVTALSISEEVTAESEAEEKEKEEGEGGVSAWIWILIAVVILAIIIGGKALKKKQ